MYRLEHRTKPGVSLRVTAVVVVWSNAALSRAGPLQIFHSPYSYVSETWTNKQFMFYERRALPLKSSSKFVRAEEYIIVEESTKKCFAS